MYLVHLVVLNFYFDLVLPFYFLKWNRYFQSVNENLPNSLRHFRKHKSVFLQIFHQSSVHTNCSSILFSSSNIIYFGQKQAIKVQIFEILECFRSKFVKFLMSIWTEKWIPLQILHHFSLSWHKTPSKF